MDEDIHICGSCKGQFTNLDEFIIHKRQCKSRVDTSIKHSGNHSAAVSLAVSTQETIPESQPSQGMLVVPVSTYEYRQP